jgi:hypothetical protein
LDGGGAADAHRGARAGDGSPVGGGTACQHQRLFRRQSPVQGVEGDGVQIGRQFIEAI